MLVLHQCKFMSAFAYFWMCVCVCHCQNGFWRQLEISAPAALPRLVDIFRRSPLTNGQPRNMTI